MGTQTTQFPEHTIKILEKRYLAKDEAGNVVETPEEMFRRVARTVAQAEKPEDAAHLEDAFFKEMTAFRFLPNSPTLMNAGRPLGQLSACFVLPVGDNLHDIFDAIKYAAIIHQSGGGTGFSFSKLRPRGDVVRSTRGVSSGPVSFMTVFNHATEAIKQGGTRRGANMGILRVDHPDILDFISCKQDTDKITNFNLSVAITDAFMQAFANDEPFALRNPRNNEPVRSLPARDIWNAIVAQAHATGEPGIVFIDRINAADPVVPVLGPIESTNPCGEQPLHAYDSCNLGSINIAKFVTPSGHLDTAALKNTVQTAVRFLDNVIDVNRYPLIQISETTRSVRKVGLGIMGWAQALILMRIPYDSEAAVETARKTMRTVQEAAYSTSEALALERGQFPAWEGSRPHMEDKPPRRNATLTTIAPTGTISLIAGASSGIEPIFALTETRNHGDLTYSTLAPGLEEVLSAQGISQETIAKIKDGIPVNELKLPADLARALITAHEVAPSWHIRMQAAFQEFTDNAVSKTINLSAAATPQDVADAYTQAYTLGCKGLTVYRDGSRAGQVISSSTAKPQTSAEHADPSKLPWGHRISRPEELPGITKKIQTTAGKLYLTLNSLKINGSSVPFEIFLTPPEELSETLVADMISGDTARQASAETTLLWLETLETYCRMTSIAAQHGTPLEPIIRQVDAVRRKYQRHVSSPTATFHRALRKAYIDTLPIGDTCPDCNGVLVMEEGCAVCKSCGFSKCS